MGDFRLLIFAILKLIDIEATPSIDLEEHSPLFKFLVFILFYKDVIRLVFF